MVDTVEKIVEEPNYLNMSEKELDDLGSPDFEAMDKATQGDEESSGVEFAVEEEEQKEEESSELDEDTEEEEPSKEESDDEDENQEQETEDEEDTDEQEEDDSTDESAPLEAEEANAALVVANARIKQLEGFDMLLKPFKAHGKNMQVNTPEEALRLMQMGVDYTANSQRLAPSLKIVKALEKNDLLDMDKINTLIAVSKHDPKAIGKIISDAKIDTDDLVSDGDYVAPDNSVGDEALVLDEVLGRIENTASFATTSELISGWDDASKQVIVKNPQYLETINTHIETGITQQIQDEIDRQQVFGGLKGLSNLEAYNQVGAELLKAGAFSGKETNTASQEEKVTIPTKTKVKDNSRTNRKKAASKSKKSSGNTKPLPDFNPLSLSAEDLDAINLDDYLLT